jgi:hypothetical protein
MEEPKYKTEFFNSCEDEEKATMSLGIMLKNNDTSAQ